MLAPPEHLEFNKMARLNIIHSLFLLLSPLIVAYSIDTVSCGQVQANPDLTADIIDTAVQDALNIAKYGIFRMTEEAGSPPDTAIVQTLLGSDGSQKFVG